MAIDATTKIGPEKNHEWGEPLHRPQELENRVSERLEELGLGDLDGQEPDPELFGYVMETLFKKGNINN